ncbi:MAG: poly-gamma-glutamate system protein [Mesotoga sp.]|uniref:poly-gamma-glutamate system protein n=2 Tax=Mesotoga sp. TaxID=2053577 RepID=UPI002603ECD9|nr:poly-gamma-glutamate system protein [Mesotoga sp.]MDD4207962.1 poly-gamma-glutamate system protein [Mesotoga sp.]MDD4825238.1 poly-gamma-glutamate system protein [Mesotoga sp.]
MKHFHAVGRVPFNRIHISLKWLLLGVVFGVAAFFIVSLSMERIESPHFSAQLSAARLMASSIAELSTFRESLGIEIDPSVDPNLTGLIGPEFTELTTTLGNLQAKRTSTNPDFAALLVKYFEELDLKRGDPVAIGASGSFPALLLAALCACEVLELEPLVIYSIGASEHGATHPEFTFVMMLKRLVEAGLLKDSLIAVSLGGNYDTASGMFFPGARELMTEIALSSGKTFIYEEPLQASIDKRLEIYFQEAEGPPSVFVNVGGAAPNFGNTLLAISLDNGLLTAFSSIPEGDERGLIFEFAELGVPVIHLLNIRDLAMENGIPIDPVPLPEPGISGVYFVDSYSLPLTLTFLFLMILCVVAGRMIKK